VSDNVELLKRIYDRFNARDMETVLAALHEDVIWANGMEGGHVHGAKEYVATGRDSGQWSIRASNRLRLRKAQMRK
jgi:ketosteroid isomerase-like protein